MTTPTITEEDRNLIEEKLESEWSGDSSAEMFIRYGFREGASFGITHARQSESEELRVLKEVVEAADTKIGPWISAAIEDPNVCAEMKRDCAALIAALAAWKEKK